MALVRHHQQEHQLYANLLSKTAFTIKIHVCLSRINKKKQKTPTFSYKNPRMKYHIKYTCFLRVFFFLSYFGKLITLLKGYFLVFTFTAWNSSISFVTLQRHRGSSTTISSQIWVPRFVYKARVEKPNETFELSLIKVSTARLWNGTLSNSAHAQTSRVTQDWIVHKAMIPLPFTTTYT